MTKRIRTVSVAAGALVILSLSFLAHAQQKPVGLPGNYPVKPVRVIISAAPGGGTDFLGRLVARNMAERWVSPFVTDNVAGAGGMIAMDTLARAPGDGYILAITSGSIMLNATFVAKAAYDVRKAFVPIAQFTTGATLVAINPNQPFNDLKGMIAYAKANPGKLNYGAPDSLLLTGELLKLLAGIDMVHVSYKGTGPSIIDAMAGRIQVVIGSITALMPHVKSGKLKSLGISAPNRLQSIADQPTLSEMGLPGFDYTTYFGIIGPSGIPQPIVNALNQEINRIINTPETIKMLIAEGSEPMTGTPEQFRDVIAGTLDKSEKVIKAAGIKLQ